MNYLTNIIDCYLRATDDEISEGMHWYDYARGLAKDWANGDVWKGAGIISAYSPNTPWWRTLELAEDSLKSGIARTDSLSMNVNKARRILAGEDVLSVLNGPKTCAFASAIADPNSDLVTVDSHAYSIAVGRPVPSSKMPKLRGKSYQEFADVYTEAANLAGFHVSSFQAITWVSWRNRHPHKASRKRG